MAEARTPPGQRDINALALRSQFRNEPLERSFIFINLADDFCFDLLNKLTEGRTLTCLDATDHLFHSRQRRFFSGVPRTQLSQLTQSGFCFA